MTKLEVAMLLVLSCVGLPIRPSDTAATVHLSAGETALLPASSYFTGSASDFYTRGEATVVKESPLEETLRVEFENEDWRIGAMLQFHEEVFFAVLGIDWVEVWSWVRDTAVVSRRVPVSRQIKKATSVNYQSPGFVLTTAPPIEVFFLPILATSHLTPLSSIDTAEASKIAVCAKVPELAVVRTTGKGAEFTFYDVDYYSYVTTSQTELFILEDTSPIVDVICNTTYSLLTPSKLYQINKFESYSLPISPSMGAGTKLQTLSKYSIFSITTESGVLLLKPDKHWNPELSDSYFPDAKFAAQLTSYEFAIDSTDGSHSLIVRKDWKFKNIKHYWRLPVSGRVDDAYWQNSASEGPAFSMLLKQGTELAVFRIKVKEPYIAVSAHDIPYAFELCAVDQASTTNSACRNLTVTAVPYDDSVVLLNNTTPLTAATNASIEAHLPSGRPNAQYILNREQWLSGANFQLSMPPPELPMGVEASVSSIPSVHCDYSTPLPSKVTGSQALCSFWADMSSRYVFTSNSLIVEVGKENEVQVTSVNQTVTMCAVDDFLLCVCGVDALGKPSLICSFLGQEFISQPVISHCIAMQLTKTHVVVVLESEVVVMLKRNLQWSRVQTHIGSPLLGAWANEYSFAVHSQRSLEVFTWQSEEYNSTLLESTASDISLLAYFGSTMVTVSSGDICTAYRMSASGLIKRYSLPMLCHVTSISVSSELFYLRCSDHIQVFHIISTFRSAKLMQIPITTSCSNLNARGNELVEVCCSEDGCREDTLNVEYGMFHSMILAFKVTPGVLLPDIFSFSVDLLVRSAVGDSGKIALNFTFHNSEGLSILDPSTRVIEVPWDQSYSLPLSALFAGHNLSFYEVESNPVGVSAINHMHFRYKLPVPTPLIRIAADINTTFSIVNNLCVITRFDCSSAKCVAKAEVAIGLEDFQIKDVFYLEVLYSTEDLVFLQLNSKNLTQYISFGYAIIIAVYDPKSQQLEVLQRWKEHEYHSKYHIIRVSASETRIFFYFSILRMCTVIGKSFTCTDINESGLEVVKSVSSEQLSPTAWNVYFLTDDLMVYQYLLTNSLAFKQHFPATVESVDSLLTVDLTGNQAIALQPDRLEVYSMPTFELIYTEYILVFKVSLFRISTSNEVRFIGVSYNQGFSILKLDFPQRLEFTSQPSAHFHQFTSPTGIAYYQEGSVYMVKLSQVGLTLQRNESAVDTVESEVTVTATNGHIRVNCTLQVIRTGKNRYPALIAGVVITMLLVAAVYVRQKKVALGVQEVEMKAIQLD